MPRSPRPGSHRTPAVAGTSGARSVFDQGQPVRRTQGTHFVDIRRHPTLMNQHNRARPVVHHGFDGLGSEVAGGSVDIGKHWRCPTDRTALAVAMNEKEAVSRRPLGRGRARTCRARCSAVVHDGTATPSPACMRSAKAPSNSATRGPWATRAAADGLGDRVSLLLPQPWPHHRNRRHDVILARARTLSAKLMAAFT